MYFSILENQNPLAKVEISLIELPTERYKRNVVRGKLDLVGMRVISINLYFNIYLLLCYSYTCLQNSVCNLNICFGLKDHSSILLQFFQCQLAALPAFSLAPVSWASWRLFITLQFALIAPWCRRSDNCVKKCWFHKIQPLKW